jgi:hypothetical protein
VKRDVVCLLRDRAEQAPLPGWGALAVGPKIRQVVIELELKGVGEGRHHIIREPRGACG